MSGWSSDEMMTIAAARLLWDRCVCFVGIGLPSAACNLARLTHAPDIVLIYESGTIGTRPEVLPLSIGDGELAEAASCVVPLPEIFSYYLQAGRVDVGFLGAAQVDRHGNLNSTVIGPYGAPRTRLPGAGDPVADRAGVVGRQHAERARGGGGLRVDGNRDRRTDRTKERRGKTHHQGRPQRADCCCGAGQRNH